MAGELAEHITLLLPDTAAPGHSKKHPCFLEAILHRSTNQDKPARRAGTKQGGQSVLNNFAEEIFECFQWWYCK